MPQTTNIPQREEKQRIRIERQVDSLNIYWVDFISLRNCAVLNITDRKHPRQKWAKKLRITANET
jgi:hypothetical protein